MRTTETLDIQIPNPPGTIEDDILCLAYGLLYAGLLATPEALDEVLQQLTAQDTPRQKEPPMRPAERYIVTCHRTRDNGDRGTLVESHGSVESALQAILAHASRPWDAIILTPSPPLKTILGHELIAGGRLQ